VAINATQARVRRNLERNEFGLHRFMTGRPAEGHRFRVFEGPITAERAHENKNHAKRDEAEERASAIGIIEIYSGKLRDLLWREPPPASPFPQHSRAHDCQPQNQSAGKQYVSEDAEVSGVSTAGELDQEEQNDAAQAGDGDSKTGKADVVMKECWNLRVNSLAHCLSPPAILSARLIGNAFKPSAAQPRRSATEFSFLTALFLQRFHVGD
jgi:hypothetical protein